MRNFVSKGKTMIITASGADIVSGQLTIQGNLAAVAAVDIADGSNGVADIEGVFELPAATAAIGLGAKVYWDADGDPVGGTAGSGACTATATDNTLIGAAVAAKGAGGATVQVKLNVALT